MLASVTIVIDDTVQPTYCISYANGSLSAVVTLSTDQNHINVATRVLAQHNIVFDSASVKLLKNVRGSSILDEQTSSLFANFALPEPKSCNSNDTKFGDMIELWSRKLSEHIKKYPNSVPIGILNPVVSTKDKTSAINYVISVLSLDKNISFLVIDQILEAVRAK